MINKTIPYFFIAFHTTFACLFFPLYSQPDLSIVGYVMPEDGIGKIPITILETLDHDITANIISTAYRPPLKDRLPDRITAALNHPDKTPGKVAILTEPISYPFRKGANYVPQESLIKIAYSMFETDRIHAEWVEFLNDKFDAVVIPDQYLVNVYINSGVRIPIFVLPIPMILSPYYNRPLHSRYPLLPFVFEEESKHKHPASFLKFVIQLLKRNSFTDFDLTSAFSSRHGSKPFIFGDLSANKNPKVLIEAFAQAFGNNPNVQLIMRAGYLCTETINIVNHLIEQFHLKNVKIEEGHLLLDQYIDQLASFDCYVNLSRGEGFSFIQREALALGIPVIVTNNTALSTICNSGYVREVPSDSIGLPSPSYQIIFDHDDVGHQFDCRIEDAMLAFLDVYENYGKYIDKARQGRDWVRQYDYTNEELRKLYRALIKPTKIILGDKNELRDGILITHSPELYQKYQQLQQSNSEENKQNQKECNLLLSAQTPKESLHEHDAFDLAQSYKDLKQFDDAIQCYKSYIQKGEERDKVWYSKFMIGEIYKEKDLWDYAIQWYLDAYEYNSNRAEPLQKIASHYRLKGENDLAYLFAKQGSLIPCPKEPALFLSPIVYAYQFDEELSIVAYYTPYKEEGFEATNRLILKKDVPRHTKNRAFKNLLFYVDNLKINALKLMKDKIRQNYEKSKTLIKHDPSYDFSHFQKPVPPIEFEDGYLLIVNEVVCQSQQRYDLHRFLYLDKNFHVKQITKPFTLIHKGIEECWEMTLDDIRKTCQIVVYSKGQNTYLLSIDFDTIHSLLQSPN